MLAGVTDYGRSQKWCWDLNPGTAAMWGFLGHGALAKVGTVQLWGAPFLPRSLGSRRDLAWKKRGERILAGGP